MTLDADALRRFRARIRAQAASAKPDPERVDRLAALLIAAGLRQARGGAPDLADGEAVRLAAVRRAEAASEPDGEASAVSGSPSPSAAQNAAQRREAAP